MRIDRWIDIDGKIEYCNPYFAFRANRRVIVSTEKYPLLT